MAVVIRMKRTGRRNAPCYRISVADSRFPRDGRTLETLGVYDPVRPNTEDQTTLNVESAREWIRRGAVPSQTVRSIFKRAGVYEELPTEKKARKRTGRRKVTKKREARIAAKKGRAERKEARHTARVSEKRAAKKAAAGASESA